MIALHSKTLMVKTTMDLLSSMSKLKENELMNFEIGNEYGKLNCRYFYGRLGLKHLAFL